MRRWAALVMLLAACDTATITAPSPAAPTPIVAPGTARADPCLTPTTYLEAFASQLSNALATLRPKVTAQPFESGSTESSVFAISGILTSFDGLEARLRSCPDTAPFETVVAGLRSRARALIEQAASASVNDASTQRDAAIGLFAILPDAMRLATASQGVASARGIAGQVAVISESSAKPLGSLAPLPTPAPTQPPANPPGPATIGLPKLSATVSGATPIRYFAIAGNTPTELMNQMSFHAPTHCGGQQSWACEVPRWAVWDVSGFFDPYTASCTITTVRIRPAYTVWLPRWTKPARVYPALVVLPTHVIDS